MRALFEDGYKLLTPAANALQPPFLLFVRLYWGWQFIQTGLGKVNNIEKVTNHFTELGIPLPAMSAHFVAGVELIGGIFLVFGLASRLTGLVLTINMLVAYIAADREALLSIISAPDKFTGATPYTFFFASLMVLIFGAGKVSADGWLAARVRRHEHAPRRSRYRQDRQVGKACYGHPPAGAALRRAWTAMQNQKCTDQIIGLKESQIGIDAKRSTNWSSRFIVRSGVPSRKSVSWFCILHQQTTYPYALAPDPSQEFDDTKRISDAAIRRLSAPKEYAREEGL